MLDILMYGGFGLVLISILVLTYLSFKQSILWGILCFIISPLPFSFIYWKETKKYLGIMLIGILMLIIPVKSLLGFGDIHSGQAASAVLGIIEDQYNNGVFSRSDISNAIGGYVKCADEVTLSYSMSSVGDKYPVKWTGVADCRFTKERVDVEVIVNQLEGGEWEHVDTTIHM